MTENKRFTHQRTDYYNFSDILDNGKWVGICHVDCEDDFVNLLNNSSEENKQLKMENNSLKLLVQGWEALDEEKDEQLNKQNQSLKKLKKENEKLKQKIKSINEILNKDIGYIESFRKIEEVLK